MSNFFLMMSPAMTSFLLIVLRRRLPFFLRQKLKQKHILAMKLSYIRYIFSLWKPRRAVDLSTFTSESSCCRILSAVENILYLVIVHLNIKKISVTNPEILLSRVARFRSVTVVCKYLCEFMNKHLPSYLAGGPSIPSYTVIFLSNLYYLYVTTLTYFYVWSLLKPQKESWRLNSFLVKKYYLKSVCYSIN